MDKKVVTIITRLGAVILSTLTSFAVTPPVISATENDGINWKTFFVFFSGALSMLLYDKLKKKSNMTTVGFWLIGALVCLLALYEILYYNHSITCFDRLRCIVSHAPLKKEVAVNLPYWIAHSEDATKNILQAYRCSPIDVWNISDLYLPYYGILLLYFTIIILLTWLLVLLSDMIQVKKKTVMAPVLVFFLVLQSGDSLFANKYTGSPKSLVTTIESEYNHFQTIAAWVHLPLGKLSFSSAIQTHMAYANGEIVINAGEIEKYTKDSSELFVKEFSRFVIAHEMGHNLQQLGYRNGLVIYRKGEFSVFIECQADIFAGLLMNLLVNMVAIPELKDNDPGFNEDTFRDSLEEVASAVYRRIFEMDRINSNIKTHPGNADRLLAIRQGNFMSNIYMNGVMLLFNDTASQKMSAADLEQVKSYYYWGAKGAGLNPDSSATSFYNNPFVWATSEAGRIIHENNLKARQLIIFGKETAFDTSAFGRIMKFSFRILNQNKDTVHLIGRVYTEITRKKDGKNIFKMGTIDAVPFDRMILPNQVELISGTVVCDEGSNFHANVVFPGDDRSLYFVYNFYHPWPDTTDTQFFDTDFTAWNNKTLDNIIDLTYFITGKRNQLFDYAKGIGRTDAKSEGDIFKKKIFYDPTFRGGNETDQKICVDRKEGSVSYMFNAFTSADISEVSGHFKEIEKRISSTYRQYRAKTVSSDEKIKTVEYKDNGKVAIRLQAYYDNLVNNYKIGMEIFGK